MNKAAPLSLVAILGSLAACGNSDEIAALETRIAALEGRTATATALSDLTARVDTLEADVADHETRVAGLETAVAANTSDIADNAVDIADNVADISNNAMDIGNNLADIATLETLTASMSARDVDGLPSVLFEGVNVYVNDGSGDTECSRGDFEDCSGVGNLIVGYNELRDEGNDRLGSHNVVVGVEHNYTRFGGLVTGSTNEIDGNAAAIAGQDNVAWFNSVTVGGAGNTAAGNYTSVVGGSNNVAHGFYSAILGGGENLTFTHPWGTFSVIVGGRDNQAGAPNENNWYATYSGIGGGNGQSTLLQYSWVDPE